MFALAAAAATLGLASTAVAGPYRRAPTLSIDVTAPESAKSVDEMTVTAIVTNTGSEPVKVLKAGSVLDSDLPTRSFFVNKGDSKVDFSGVKISLAMDKLTENNYVTIQPGSSVNATHDLSSLYNFEGAGAGDFSIEPVTWFQVPDVAANKVKSISDFSKVEVQANSATVSLSGDLSRRALAMKRAENACDDSSKSGFIDSSYTEAKELATTASDYIGSNSDSDLLTSYFGSNSASDVADVFDAVAGENDSSRTLNCNDEANACSDGVIAYTIISTTNIYFCDIFFDEVETTELCSGTTVAERNIRGGTTLHELTHALSDTEDVGYGCQADQQLSDSEMISNADNFNCFSTQVYADTQC
ncbi:Deuterolysin metalloprotease family-domain-containing protein [Schizophyllum amplum]|uniref:deuterolysin n=1 Tax=Schizophyllum amplum TaxID=97359 RepID=A0A550CRG2_9AGAR|nr:Deuterolysin metalloprotease family-domain-containing protein [Auriculariopsis ampla]